MIQPGSAHHDTASDRVLAKYINGDEKKPEAPVSQVKVAAGVCPET